MVKITTIYQGQKHCELTHEPSQTKIETDAPLDNQGRGEKFSPTDLVAGALASCVLTTMAMVCERDGVSLVGAKAEVVKEMVTGPRRIGKLNLVVEMPKGIPADYRERLLATASHCPVHQSLRADIEANIDLRYPD